MRRPPFLHPIVAALVLTSLLSAQQSPTTIDELKKKAEAGDAKAQNQLGVAYRVGDGVPKDYALAVKWYSQAAKSGYADGLFNLGISYYNGDGVGVDPELAYAWLALAAGAGSQEAKAAMDHILQEKPYVTAGAERRLAEIFEGTTPIVHVDYAQAFQWYSDAAEKGDSESQYKSCEMLYRGTGVTKDISKAFYWCERASSDGYDTATFAVAQMFEKGLGTDQNFKKAAQYYKRASNAGHALATYKLGILNKNGQGVKQSDKEAYYWFLIANAFGVKDALPEMEALHAKLSKNDESRAKIDAASWWQKMRKPERKVITPNFVQ